VHEPEQVTNQSKSRDCTRIHESKCQISNESEQGLAAIFYVSREFCEHAVVNPSTHSSFQGIDRLCRNAGMVLISIDRRPLIRSIPQWHCLVSRLTRASSHANAVNSRRIVTTAKTCNFNGLNTGVSVEAVVCESKDSASSMVGSRMSD
jgi:hypothetical protein